MGGFFETKMEGMEMVMGIMFELLEVRGYSSWQLGSHQRSLGKMTNKKKEPKEYELGTLVIIFVYYVSKKVKENRRKKACAYVDSFLAFFKFDFLLF